MRESELMSERARKQERGGVTGKTDRCSVFERVLGEKDGSPKTDFEHSLHHSAECKSAVTGGARGIKISQSASRFDECCR